MPSVTALRRWLVFVALLRLLSGPPCWMDAAAMLSACGTIAAGTDCMMGHCLFLFSIVTGVLHIGPRCIDKMCEFAVYLGVCQYKYFQSNLFDLRPDLGEPCRQIHSTRSVLSSGLCQGSLLAGPLMSLCTHAVNELYGRTFATWTITTCVLCLICAKNPRVPAIYGG